MANGWNPGEYDEWRKKVQGSGQYWSDWDLERAANDKDWANAAEEYKTGWYDARANDDKEGQARYHSLMENLRSGTQYSGGAEGDEYHPWGSDNSARPSWDTDGSITAALDTARNAVKNWAPYSSPYTDRIEAALGKVENFGPYESRWQPQIDSQINGIVGYGPYQSEYADRINNALTAIEGRGPFEYDLESDPVWQAYRKQYTREGRRATEDTLGQMAAMTGGMPSTAAMTAASQAGDYYNAQMTDKVPELYKLAYDIYLSEGDRMRQSLNDLRGLDSDAYGRYADTYNRMLSGLNALQGQDAVEYGRYGDDYNRLLTGLNALNDQDAIAYGRYGDEYGRAVDAYNLERDANNTAYSRYRDTVGDWETDRSFNYGVSRDNWSDALTAAQYGDDTRLNALGVDTSRYRSDEQYKKDIDFALNAAQYGDLTYLENMGIHPNMENLLNLTLANSGRTVPVGSGGSGGSGGGGGGGGGGSDADDAYVPEWYSDEQRKNKFFSDAYASGLASNYISTHYKDYGYDKASGLTSAYNAWLKSMGGSLTPVNGSDVLSGDPLGYEPLVFDPSITSMRGLGSVGSAGGTNPAVDRIVRSIGNMSIGLTPAEVKIYAADAIEDALDKKEISPAEADELLRQLGR